MIRWQPPVCESVAPLAPMRALIERAIRENPANPALRVKHADLQIDRFEFAAAAASLEVARQLAPDDEAVTLRLARCYNGIGRHEDAIALFGGAPGPFYQRALASLEVGREAEAEAELRAVLAEAPNHRHAAWKLFKLLRSSGRTAEVLVLCESLFAAGVAHSQLFYDWGRALATEGEFDRARSLLFDPARVVSFRLDPLAGYSDIGDFNAALASALLTNPAAIDSFPIEEANRGSSRIHNLYAGGAQRLIQPLLETLQSCVERYAADLRPSGSFDPWSRSRPPAAHLRPWGLIQKGDAYEEWHLHRGGWLSGVYYVRVPTVVSADGEGPGCIEFGPPLKIAEQFPQLAPTLRIAPEEGVLLLSPSHYLHRTIPTGSDEYRISFAFDVVPAE